ncbi:helix-turn-helix domain-containing protein [Enterococcus avium]|uniref:helix-turn-helix domain-containing protein n=1 Tax=Enterococcus avium TaxID=33945 RepID=UPI0022E18A04|nr:helix-turn-helix transcriptional regulator [Enterococcus avium]
MTVGERIAKLREKRGLSQMQLAKDLKVATSTLGMWETGKRGLKDDTLKMIAEYFNVSSDYLLGIDNKDTSFENKKAETVAAHIDDDVSDDEMKEILNFIDYIKQRDHS